MSTFITCFYSLFTLYTLYWILTALTPGILTPGYALLPNGIRSVYNLNGLRVLFIVLTLIFSNLILLSTKDKQIFTSYLYNNYGNFSLAACIIGLLASLFFYIRGLDLLSKNMIDRRSRCLTATLGQKVGQTIPTINNEQIPDVENDLTSVKITPTKRNSNSNRTRARTPSPRRQSSTTPNSNRKVSKFGDYASVPIASPSTSRKRLGRNVSSTSEDTKEFDQRTIFEAFYAGVSEFNPVLTLFPGFPSVDVKMWLYIAGAVQLQLNVLSCVSAQAMQRGASAIGGITLPSILGGGTITRALFTYALCMTFFVVEYLYNEEVHLYTYDLFRERIGLKLVWGCLFFYPMFYATGAVQLANHPYADISSFTAVVCITMYFIGWFLTRGANLQKFAVKQGAKKFSFLGIDIPMHTVPGSNGRLLSSGFWALARHINYFGELLQAFALAIPVALACTSILPFSYPLYYIILFIPRQIDDDAMCAAKYGPKVWNAYTSKVTWRIIPGIY